ncbi:hypothetical protein [Streptomyces sp. NPDC002250]|uniref:hypothetical protein n=1 Tax=Streptomyces sp. NPDC002250 TaxID=3364641 RepID=UPI00369B68E8
MKLFLSNIKSRRAKRDAGLGECRFSVRSDGDSSPLSGRRMAVVAQEPAPM